VDGGEGVTDVTTRDDFFNALDVQRREEQKWHCFVVGAYTVHLFVGTDTDLRGRLDEARSKGKHLGGQYYAHLHGPHTPKGQRHVHVTGRSGKLFALNQDGTAHDASHRYRIPNEAADGLRQLLPDFKIPDDNFIEELNPEEMKALLLD